MNFLNPSHISSFQSVCADDSRLHGAVRIEVLLLPIGRRAFGRGADTLVNALEFCARIHVLFRCLDDDVGEEIGAHESRDSLPLMQACFDSRLVALAQIAQSVLLVVTPEVGAQENDEDECNEHVWNPQERQVNVGVRGE